MRLRTSVILYAGTHFSFSDAFLVHRDGTHDASRVYQLAPPPPEDPGSVPTSISTGEGPSWPQNGAGQWATWGGGLRAGPTPTTKQRLTHQKFMHP